MVTLLPVMICDAGCLLCCLQVPVCGLAGGAIGGRLFLVRWRSRSPASHAIHVHHLELGGARWAPWQPMHFICSALGQQHWTQQHCKHHVHVHTHEDYRLRLGGCRETPASHPCTYTAALDTPASFQDYAHSPCWAPGHRQRAKCQLRTALRQHHVRPHMHAIPPRNDTAKSFVSKHEKAF